MKQILLSTMNTDLIAEDANKVHFSVIYLSLLLEGYLLLRFDFMVGFVFLFDEWLGYKGEHVDANHKCFSNGQA